MSQTAAAPKNAAVRLSAKSWMPDGSQRTGRVRRAWSGWATVGFQSQPAACASADNPPIVAELLAVTR